MKRFLIYTVLVIFVYMPLFSGCSEKTSGPEKGLVKEFTEKTGKAAAEGIKRPIDRARALQEKSVEKVDASDRLLDEE